nr:paternally-expressed gene 3 protein-like [Procambarus clarkii]
MVDMGGETRERFQDIGTAESEDVLPPVSTVTYYHSHHASRPSSWRDSLQEVTARQNLLESMHHDLIQIKNDPENLSSLCNSSSSVVFVEGSSVSSLEAAEDARARGQLFQEITHAAETFEPYSSSTSNGCFRNYGLATDPTAHPEYIFSDTIQWSWNRSPADDRSLTGSAEESILVGSGQPNETVITSLQYTVPPHLISDNFSSPLPSISVAQLPTSVPVCSSILPQVQPSPPSPTTLTSSALDLSPGHQLPPVQPTLMSQAPTHMAAVSPPSSAHQLPHLHPSLIALDMTPHALSTQHALDDTLDQAHSNKIATTCVKCENDSLALEPKTTHPLPLPEKPFSCKHCNETFPQEDRLKVHELSHTGERTFKCDECGTAFSAKAMLIRHMKVHTGEKPYSCDECKTCFTETSSLKVHKRLHSGEKPFKCDQCDVAFNGAGMLVTHKRKHTGEKPYRCSECGETFRLLSTLKSHRRRHTGEKPFVCEVCGSSFTQRAAMQRHKRIHSNQKPWKCEECGYKFREKENLRKHIAHHQIKLQHMCNICGLSFNQAKKLEIHKILHNGGERPYQCNKCPSTFTTHKYLTQHEKRVHDRKGAIRCEECNGTFKRKEILRSHMKIHKGDRPYVCEECGAAFNQRGTLTKHIRTHNNSVSVSDNKCDEHYECKICSHIFVDKVSYEHHKLDHTEIEDASFSCPSCIVSFSCQEELVRHKRTNHPVLRTTQGNSGSEQDVDDSSEHIRDKYVCEDCDQTFFRRRQLKAHKKYCPCSCPALQAEPLKDVNTGTSLQSNTKEVDAMKLLTAVLAVTDEASDGLYQHSVGRGSPSVEHPLQRYPSPSSISSTVEQAPHHYSSPHLLSPCDSIYPQHVSVHHQENHMQQPSQEFQLSQSSQQPPQDNLQQISHQQVTLQHLSHDNLQHLPEQHNHLHHTSQSNLQKSSHRQDHIQQINQQQAHLQQLPQEHTSLHQSVHQHDHSQQPSQDHVRQLPRQHDHSQQPSQDHVRQLPRQHDHSQQPSQDHVRQLPRQHDHSQQPSQDHVRQLPRQHDHSQQPSQDHVRQLPRQHDHSQQPSQDHVRQLPRQHDHSQQPSKQQDYLQHPTRQHSTDLQQTSREHSHLHQTGGDSHLQQINRRQTQLQHQTQQQDHLQRSSHGPDQLHQSLRQDHLQNHLQFDQIVQQEFYKESSLSLPIQHPLHHTQELQALDQPGQNVHPQDDHLQELHQNLQRNLEDCENFGPSIHHQDQLEPDNCDQHSHHLQEPEQEELREAEHHNQHHHRRHHHHQHPSTPPLENSCSIKILNIPS